MHYIVVEYTADGNFKLANDYRFASFMLAWASAGVCRARAPGRIFVAMSEYVPPEDPKRRERAPAG